MGRVNSYLFTNFISTFASLFSTLFLIMSIVFFIQIARITSYIEITFFELFKLYLFMLPRILLFTIPIAFFVSLAMTLFRLSKENESIVIFTLGYSPNFIARFFMLISSIVSIFLLITAIILIPTAAELNGNFIEYKKTIAKLNLKTTQFGQKFSNWMIYIQSQKNDINGTTYEGVTLYSPQINAQRLIIAENAKIINNRSNLELRLNNGKIYDIKDDVWHQADFKYMKINTLSNDKISKTRSFLEYWSDINTNKKKARDFTTYVLIALFPVATTLFALSFGVVTYRYEKGFVYFGTFGVLFAYFAMIMMLSSKLFIAILSIFSLFLISSMLFYKKTILKRY
ncbi:MULTISPECIES: LptF/LptG family permease [unclassified Campylobacter]|uniref:LptF/LptG family permease n=1 Tax=unclassified Campylobacter TaxID=2593542 RepID=UPI0014750303|nr:MULTISPECIES: LptF/LptG family permease [unclassified Campylobacter]